MFNQNDLEKIVFLDIETVPTESNYNSLSDIQKEHWDGFAKKQKNDDESADDPFSKAGLRSEFGKIICVGIGKVKALPEGLCLLRRAFYGHDERALIESFVQHESIKNSQAILCAHNGKGFDFPFLARRMVINDIPIPNCLQIAGKKPWEIAHLDTMEYWRFGQWGYNVSLDLLTHVLSLQSSKHDMSGDKVADVYWKEGNLEKIASYCKEDVRSLTEISLKFAGIGPLNSVRDY